jgi:hypothetical protein
MLRNLLKKNIKTTQNHLNLEHLNVFLEVKTEEVLKDKR